MEKRTPFYIWVWRGLAAVQTFLFLVATLAGNWDAAIRALGFALAYAYIAVLLAERQRLHASLTRIGELVEPFTTRTP